MPASTVALISSASMALLTFVSGAFLAVVPWLGRRREAFAVTIPEVAQADPRIRSLRRAYLAVMLAVSAACAAGSLAAAAHPLALSALVCLPVLCGFLLMLAFRGRVRALKRAEGWEARRERTSAFVAPAGAKVPRPLPLTWELLGVPVLLATLALSLALYPSYPDQIPVHFDMNGQVNGYLPHDWRAVVTPLALQAFLGACCTASHWTMLRSKRGVSPEAPAASALAYGMFVRAQSVVLVATAVLAEAVIALMPLTFAEVIEPTVAIVAVLVVCLAACVAGLGVSAAYGQGGARLLRRMGASAELLSDDDALWHAGVFYANRDDPAVVVPRRFGVGWAMNWGNPRSWALTALFAAAVVAFVAGLGALLG